MPGGGIWRPRNLRTTFSKISGCCGHGLGAKLVQKEVAGANVLVVATEAVEPNGGPLRFGMLRDLVRGLGEDLGVGRNDTDGTRNADKPSSEFHISHHLASLISDFPDEHRSRGAS